MTIKEVLASNNGDKIDFRGVLSKKDLLEGQNGKYLNVVLCDATGEIKTPIFNNAEKAFEVLEIGVPYEVHGRTNIWNGTTQIKDPEFNYLEKDSINPEDFIAKYDIPNDMVSEFHEIVGGLSEPYQTIVKLATGCAGNDDDRFKKFLTAPSAKSKHGNQLGGLFLHTYGMLCFASSILKNYKNIDSYNKSLSDVVDKDRLITKIIVHDIEKISEYVYDTYIGRKENVVGHLYDGVTLISNIGEKIGLDKELTENLKTSILSHHGQYGPMEPRTIEDILVHLADMADSRIVGELDKD